jgi:predicted DNA-binding transcriptional regulator AlpA
MITKFMTNADVKYMMEDVGDRILTQKEVLEILPVSRSTLIRMQKQGLFPPHFKIGVRKNGWLESEVVSWIDNVQEGNIVTKPD